jgi:large subunit ribosomal protein L30
MWVVIRLRGRCGVYWKVRGTLEMLRLRAPWNCVLLPETPSFKGMLEVVKDWVTWGEIERPVLVELLRKRLRAVGQGNKRVEESELEELTGFASFEELADALLTGKLRLKDIKGVKPVFRLRPPSKGLKSIRLPWPKGDLGYRSKEINKLLERMV